MSCGPILMRCCGVKITAIVKSNVMQHRRVNVQLLEGPRLNENETDLTELRPSRKKITHIDGPRPQRGRPTVACIIQAGNSVDGS